MRFIIITLLSLVVSNRVYAVRSLTQDEKNEYGQIGYKGKCGVNPPEKYSVQAYIDESFRIYGGEVYMAGFVREIVKLYHGKSNYNVYDLRNHVDCLNKLLSNQALYKSDRQKSDLKYYIRIITEQSNVIEKEMLEKYSWYIKAKKQESYTHVQPCKLPAHQVKYDYLYPQFKQYANASQSLDRRMLLEDCGRFYFSRYSSFKWMQPLVGFKNAYQKLVNTTYYQQTMNVCRFGKEDYRNLNFDIYQSLLNLNLFSKGQALSDTGNYSKEVVSLASLRAQANYLSDDSKKSMFVRKLTSHLFTEMIKARSRPSLGKL